MTVYYSCIVFLLCLSSCLSSGDQKLSRLEGGVTPYEGRVSIYLPDHGWTPVCEDQYWITDAADILCRDLGHSAGAMWNKSPRTSDESVGPVCVVNMQCEGSEDKLQDCDFEVDLSCHCNQAKATCNYDGYDGCYEVVNCELSEEFVNDKMTIQLCLEYCRKSDFMLGMLQSGDRCICRDKDAKCDSWQRKENTRCYVPCGGDESQACGGNSIIAGVYNVQMGACGGRFTEDGGTIYSPGFPGFYTGNNHCTWAVGLVKDHVGLDFTILKISGDNDIIVFAEILDGSARIIDQRNKTWNPELSIYSCSNEVMIGLQRKEGQGDSIFAIAYKSMYPLHLNYSHHLSAVQYLQTIRIYSFIVTQYYRIDSGSSMNTNVN